VMTEVVAIDGMSATGKSTIGRLVAEALTCRFLDSGLVYRAAAYARISQRFESLDDFAGALSSIMIEVMDREVLVDGIVVTKALSDRALGPTVAVVAAHPRVRATLTDWLRERIAHWGSAVVVGRDIGTVVFSDAILKVFLTADPVVRAQRRAAELVGSDLRAVAEALMDRDRRDSDREVAPLVPAADAVRVDTTTVTPGEVAELLIARLRERRGQSAFQSMPGQNFHREQCAYGPPQRTSLQIEDNAGGSLPISQGSRKVTRSNTITRNMSSIAW
jgi:cytidylate kinase